MNDLNDYVGRRFGDFLRNMANFKETNLPTIIFDVHNSENSYTLLMNTDFSDDYANAMVFIKYGNYRIDRIEYFPYNNKFGIFLKAPVNYAWLDNTTANNIFDLMLELSDKGYELTVKNTDNKYYSGFVFELQKDNRCVKKVISYYEYRNWVSNDFSKIIEVVKRLIKDVEEPNEKEN